VGYGDGSTATVQLLFVPTHTPDTLLHLHWLTNADQVILPKRNTVLHEHVQMHYNFV